MFKIGNKKAQATPGKSAGQAATELAVFGAILIFLIGTIVRSAAGNSFQQNESFKAMRMAMLASWRGSKAANTARNNASILFVEDRLSPDSNKYGSLDRNPYIAQGSGSFTYEMLYPLSTAGDFKDSLPIMDVYINGQYFPFTLASYVHNYPVKIPTSFSPSQCRTDFSCEANKCLRRLREWAGGSIGLKVRESSFATTSVALVTVAKTTLAERKNQMQDNACIIFNDLISAGIFPTTTTLLSCGTGSGTDVDAVVSPDVSSPLEKSPQWNTFKGLYQESFPNNTQPQNNNFLHAILIILRGEQYPYKLFYKLEANPGGSESSGFFKTIPPICNAHPCKMRELSADRPLLDYNLTPTGSTNSNGVMQYDLLRMGFYAAAPTGAACINYPCQSVIQQFPLPPGTETTGCKDCARNYVAWQWAATAGTTADMIGLVSSTQSYPSFDIDGRLKEVTIYWINRVNGTTYLNYEDGQGGDIDQSWDSNSCGPKPGLQADSQIYTFTKNGTYLQINEGKIYNPETGQVVRSANKRDSVDLIQRTIQLSNDTGRFCSSDNPPVPLATVDKLGVFNQVEKCVNEQQCTCFMGKHPDGTLVSPSCGYTLAETCFDSVTKKLFVRSRLQDLRGRFWKTNTSGQLKVQ